MAANFLHATDLGSDTDDSDYVPDDKEVQGLSEEEDPDQPGMISPLSLYEVLPSLCSTSSFMLHFLVNFT